MDNWFLGDKGASAFAERRLASLAFAGMAVASLFLAWALVRMNAATFTTFDPILYKRIPFYGLYMGLSVISLLMIPALALHRPFFARPPLREIRNLLILLGTAFMLHQSAMVVHLDLGMTFAQRSAVFVHRLARLGSTGVFPILCVLGTGWLTCRLVGKHRRTFLPLRRFCANGLRWTFWLALMELLAYEAIAVAWLVWPL